MKYGKEILVMAVIMLLIVAVMALGMTLRDVVSNSQNDKDIKGRIRQYKLILEEQRLVTEIVTLKYDAAVIQAKFQPAPTAPPVAPPTNE